MQDHSRTRRNGEASHQQDDTMNENTQMKPAGQDTRIIVLFGILFGLAVSLLCCGLILAARSADMRMLSAGILAIIIVVGLYPIASTLSVRHEENRRALNAITLQLSDLAEAMMLSDETRRAVYRDRDLAAIRKAINKDVERAGFDGALALIERIIRLYGSHEEAEQLRSDVQSARSKWLDRKIDDASTKLDRILARHDWPAAESEARRIEQMFPESPRIKGIRRRVMDERDQHKLHLEREFLAAASKDDIERAMQTLRELDAYLTEEEAAPFRETARGVVTKKRTNLGVQFKLAVHNRDWPAAFRIGREIMDSFPNTKMAAEIRGMYEQLEARATDMSA